MARDRYEKLIVNGRFLSAPQTGVQRVAHELVSALSARSAELAELMPFGMGIATPRKGQRPGHFDPYRMGWPAVCSGHLWEQLEFPLRARLQSQRGLLLNLCNLSPAISSSSIVMIHDAQTFSSPASYGKAFGTAYRAALPVIGRRSERVLTVSKHSAADIASYGIAPVEKIRVIYNGVDHVLRNLADRTIVDRMGLADQSYVLALGSDHAHKNIRRLVEAFTDPSLASLKLVLFGGRDVRAALLGTTPDPGNILWAGRVSDAEMRALAESALCFAMPSITEGFGLPPLEAMLLGCPTIVSHGGALPEVCGEAALYAPADETRPWIDAILALEADPGLRLSYVESGKRQASRFTWDAAADQLLAVIAEVQQQ